MNIAQQITCFFSEGNNTPSFNHNYFRKQEFIAAYARNVEAINQLLYEGYDVSLSFIKLTPEAQEKLKKILEADAAIQLDVTESIENFLNALGFATYLGFNNILRIYSN